MLRSLKKRRRRLLTEQLETRQLLAGPHAPAAGEIGSTAVAHDDPGIVAWATAVDSYTPGSDVTTDFQTPNEALGPVTAGAPTTVSLGRGGQITFRFDAPIRDGLGADFAVFENSFSDTFLELGYVEVSSDGVNFFRFDSDSRTPAAVDAFGAVDPTDVHNLAGKYRQGFGTPFDLEELDGRSTLLDITHVTHVRLIDVVGDGSAFDAGGRVIYDPFPTAGSAGMDVDAVGVIHQAESGREVIGFEDVGAALNPQTAFSGPDPNGTTSTGQFNDVVVLGNFQSETLSFNNAYSNNFGSWNGWAYSNATDTTTAGFTNQFSAFAGQGASGSATFAVGFPDLSGFYDLPTISRDVDDSRLLDSLMVTNTTYAALSMRDGDQFAKKFGGASGNDEDFLLLTIDGKDAAGTSVGTVDFCLADYRFADNTMDYIVDRWVEVDLSSIAKARSLEFTISSSDVGPFGVNTPAFFAIDDIAFSTPKLPLDIDDRTVSEADGATATIARISRADNDTSAAIGVSISAVDPTIAIVPGQVSIGVGQRYVEFPIGVVDDELFGVDKVVTIEASADGLLTSSKSLVIQENDSRALSLVASENIVAEGSSIDVTVSRNDANLSSSLTVQVTTPDGDLISSDSTVTIDSGQASKTFTITAIDDGIDRPDRQVAVSVNAVGYTDGQTEFTVTDDDVPTVTIQFGGGALDESIGPPNIGFEDVGAKLAPQSFFNGSDFSGGFESQNLLFNNDYNPDFGSWSGWAYSNTTDTTTAGYLNQYSVITGGGAHGSDTYAVASAFTTPTITRSSGAGPFESIAISNTTYAALSMQQGDAFAKRFGGETGDDPDFFLLTIDGLDGDGNSLGAIDFYLADYRFADNTLDYVVDQWAKVDLSPIGHATTLSFSLSSSDVGSFGMNTPAYFAVDDVVLQSSSDLPMITVARNTTDVTASLDVLLTSSDTSEVMLPSAATIPAGASSVQIPLSVRQDELVDGDQDVTLTVEADSHIGSSVVLTVADQDLPTLKLTVLDHDVLESGQGRLVVHRNTADTTAALEVDLLAGVGQQLTLPSPIQIPSGHRAVEITFTAIDDDEINADRVVTIDAIALGFVTGQDSVRIVNDDQMPPELVLELDGGSLSESDAPRTVQFEEIGATLVDQSFNNGADGAGGFIADGLLLNNFYESTFGSWGGWAISNRTDITTAGFGNQYSAFAGGGAFDSATFAVASAYPGGTAPTLTMDDASGVRAFESLMITNTTYAALSMTQGDAFAKQFGGATGDDPDYFVLTIEGVDGSSNSVGTIEFPLADFRFSDNSLDYIVDDWIRVDVSELVGATQLSFSLDSSDVGAFGMNTPAYFAIDQVVLSDPPANVITATVSRTDIDISAPLTVNVASDDESEASVPESVTIPAGVSSATFVIESVDDAIVDGRKDVQIDVTADTHVGAMAQIVVFDNDLPTITMSLESSALSEAAGVAATNLLIHRNTANLAVPLTLQLTTDSEPGSPDLLLGDHVTIPVGMRSVVVPIGVIDNFADDGDRTVTIRGTANAFNVATATIEIIDDEMIGIVVD
ncbi:MAG: DUF4465 domain-containing protein, partial [Pirellulaceae bacterium]|nr:DUF4465 domain-containing protein [Pirellulaceae bacterium]